MIIINNITKHFGDRIALENINMAIPDNCIVGLVGKNGSGKSTLLKILTGITKPNFGEILFDNKAMDISALTNKIGYLPEQRGLYNTVEVQKQLEYFASLKGISRKSAAAAIDYWLTEFDIKEWKNRLVSELSKGMQQKVQMISCLIHNPQYLFMDEPLSGVDPVNFEVFTKVIRTFQHRTHSTVVLSTHNMKSIEKMCDYMAFVNDSHLLMYDTIKNIKDKFSDYNTYVLKIKKRRGDNMISIASTLDRYSILSCKQDTLTMDEIFIRLSEKK